MKRSKCCQPRDATIRQCSNRAKEKVQRRFKKGPKRRSKKVQPREVRRVARATSKGARCVSEKGASEGSGTLPGQGPENGHKNGGAEAASG